MKIIGCDYHPSFQQIAMLDRESGEYTRKKLLHANGEAAEFYRGLQGEQVRVGMAATGSTRWFERLLEELGQELVMGDATRIRKMAVRRRRQKTDRRDAEHMLELLERGQFPAIWVPSGEERELRELVLHRHKLVQMRTRVKNQLQHVALNEGLQKKRQLWTRQGREWLEALALPRWSKRRREDLLHFLDELQAKVEELDAAVSRAAEQDERVRLLRTHPGVGPVTGLALVVGDITRFPRSKHLTSYLGLIPAESSSGERRRLGGISKQGNTVLRTLLVEAGQSAARCDAELGRAYQRLCRKKQHTGTAKVMVARKLAVRLYWMLKSGQSYCVARMSSSPSHSVSAA